MTTTSHDLLLNELRATGREFLTSLAHLSPDQWHFKPGPDLWSIAETAEHVTLVETGAHRVITTRLLQQPSPLELRAQARAKDSLITTMMFDRSVRRPAPDFVMPKGTWPEASALVQAFDEARSGTITWLQSCTVDLRDYSSVHPTLGHLDGKQWILFIAAHAERHTRQIQEVKIAEGFPKA